MNRVQKFMHKFAILWSDSDDRPRYMCDVYFKFLQVAIVFSVAAGIILAFAGALLISVVQLHRSYFAGTETLTNVLITDITIICVVSYFLFHVLSQNFSSFKEKHCTKITD